MDEKKKAREGRNKEKLTQGDWVMAEFYATWLWRQSGELSLERLERAVKEFKNE